MKTFSLVSGLLTAATVLALLAKDRPEPPPQAGQAGQFVGVLYSDIKVEGGVRCRFAYDVESGAEFKAEFMGLPHVMVAYDNSDYWFWMRNYDPRRYYFCRPDESEDLDLIPPLRRSFCRWAVNRESDKPDSFKDGMYTVEIKTKDNMVVSQTYLKDGAVEAEVRVVAFQEVGGLVFPALAVLEMPEHGLKLSIEMGRPEVNPEVKPDTSPPGSLKGRSLSP